MGGKDAIYVKQHQSSTLTKAEMETHVNKLFEARFQSNPNTRMNSEDRVCKHFGMMFSKLYEVLVLLWSLRKIVRYSFLIT